MMRFHEASKKAIPFLLIPLLFLACSGSKEQANGGTGTDDETVEDSKGRSDKSEGKEMQAKVKDFSHLDGCSYLLIGPEEKKYHPLNLDTAYFEDDLKVEVRYRKKDAITTCMAGTTIHIQDIKTRD